MRDPNEIQLSDLTKQFEYRRMCDEIDHCNDINELKLAVKCYLKLYLSTLETIHKIQHL
jgi:hypothetical protein